ncbi:hypothetical protein KAU33_13895 [Candidatus Dependentiae bacterium]|nr:hypothetical protein [Candidatus Dependentiae bacterium]
MAKKGKTFDPRKYMEQAIEVMPKSVPELREDGKIVPHVGAVLLFPDGSIKVAARGELRDGEHAEYTLLERKCLSLNLDNCILFVTLEPCVKRNDPKQGCSKRIVKSRIKKGYIGVQDPDPTVSGDGIRYLESCGVEVKMFDRDLQNKIEKIIPDYLEQANQRVSGLVKEIEIPNIRKSVKNTNVNDLSVDAIEKFIKEAKLPFKFNSIEFYNYLVNLGVLVLDEKEKKKKLTGIGYLLFSKTPGIKYPQSVIRAHIEYGKEKIESIDFDEPLVLLPNLIEKWLNKVLPFHKDTSKFKRKDLSDFPISVIREAVINAIIHRDYEIEQANIGIEIDNSKIVINSPGPPIKPITIEQLNNFNAPSLSRNKAIMYVYSKMNYVEGKKFGMKTFKLMNENYGLPLPHYKFNEPILSLTFARSVEKLKEIDKMLSSLTLKEIAGYEFIRSKNKITKKEYAEKLGYSDRQAERHLKKFLDLSLITRISSGPSTFYKVIGK